MSFNIFVDRPASLQKNQKTSSTPKKSRSTRSGVEKSPPNTANCCECFPSPKKKWTDTSSSQMSDVYSIEDKADFSSPACLAVMSKGSGFKHLNLLGIDSEIEFKDKNKIKIKSPSKKTKSVNGNDCGSKYDVEVADDAMLSTPEDELDARDKSKLSKDPKLMIRVNGKEEFPSAFTTANSNSTLPSSNKKKQLVNSKSTDPIIRPFNRTKSHSIAEVHNLSSPKNSTTSSSPVSSSPARGFQKFFSYSTKRKTTVPTKETSFIEKENSLPKCEFKIALDQALNDINGNENPSKKKSSAILDRNYSTLPKMRKSHFHPSILYSREPNRTPFKVPKRTTADNTNIYYWCDVPKKRIKGLLN